MASPESRADHGASATPPPQQPDLAAQGAALGQAALGAMNHGARAGLAWLRLVQSEAALAKANVWRLVIAGLVALLAVFFTWISAAVALGAALMATGLPVAAALALVFLAHVLVLLTLALLMRRWSRTLGFPRSKAAFMSLFEKRSEP